MRKELGLDVIMDLTNYYRTNGVDHPTLSYVHSSLFVYNYGFIVMLLHARISFLAFKLLRLGLLV